MLPKLARLLNVTTDELLGLEPLKKARQPDTRLQRRLVQVIDTFLKAAQLSESASNT